MARDDIRKAILNSKPKTALVKVFGQEVEIRQARVGEVLEDNEEIDGKKVDRATAFAHLLVRFCYVPGTNDRVFEDTDVDALKSIPLGAELQELQSAINSLMGLDIGAERKNLPKARSATT